MGWRSRGSARALLSPTPAPPPAQPRPVSPRCGDKSRLTRAQGGGRARRDALPALGRTTSTGGCWAGVAAAAQLCPSAPFSCSLLSRYEAFAQVTDDVLVPRDTSRSIGCQNQLHLQYVTVKWQIKRELWLFNLVPVQESVSRGGCSCSAGSGGAGLRPPGAGHRVEVPLLLPINTGARNREKQPRARAGRLGHMAAHSSLPGKSVLEKMCWEKKRLFEDKHRGSSGKALSLQNTN